MDYTTLLNKINNQIKYVDKLSKQINILNIIGFEKYKNQTDEEVVRYDSNKLFADFSFKINKIIFFLKKYLTLFNDIVSKDELLKQNNISLCPDKRYEELTFYFDAFIASVSVVFESEQKQILSKYLNAKDIEKIYPSRNRFGIWWQIYMLRNRILHTTETRYDGNTNKCSRYMEFSSKILMVQIKDNEISLLSTLIDIHKDINIKKAIDISIKNRDYNPFDLLFPYKSAKGKGKSEPMVLYISNDIYFDYVISGTKLIDEVLKIIELINQEFLTEFSKYYSDKDELYKIKTCYDKMDDTYTINDVFN